MTEVEMVVNKYNLFSEVRTHIVDLINSNVADPKTNSTNSNRRWFYREFPKTTSYDFQGYPFLVIKSPEHEEDNQDLLGYTSDSELNMIIEIYTEYNDVDARIDELSNNIYSALSCFENKKELMRHNIDLFKVSASQFDNIEQDNKKLSTRNLLLMMNSTLEG